jgi:orotate phosphoribosyltransferase
VREWSLDHLLDETGSAGFARRGHFRYESGDHGDTWLALELLFARPSRLEAAARVLAERLGAYEPDVVCGPLIGGALVGQRIAHLQDADFVYAEASGGATPSTYVLPPALRASLPGRRVLVVDDAINAGAATLGCVRAVRALGGDVVAVGALLVRAEGTIPMLATQGLRAEYLATVPFQTWSGDDCPLCRAGVPLESPLER